MIIRTIFLAPLALLFGLITTLRNKLYDLGALQSYRSNLRVISVGNITVGGNGKTPFTMYLADKCRRLGFRPVILSRGYKGREKGPVIVIPNDSSQLVGDEPKLMSNAGHVVVVAKDRVAGARWIEERELGDLIILDDGAQHRKLKRDVELLCVDIGTEEAVDHILKGKLMPLGRLRERVKPSLERAHAIIFSCNVLSGDLETRAQQISKKLPLPRPYFVSSTVPEGVYNMSDGQELRPSEVQAISALAKPKNFIETLKSLGFTVKKEHSFPDHYSFSRDDLLPLDSDLPIVCTAKDEVKIREIEGIDHSKFYVLKVSLEVKGNERLAELIG